MPSPHIVIVGAGFGGLQAARTLGRAGSDVRVTVVDRTNHFLFQPLLYQVATATLSPADITAPVRYLLRKYRNTSVLMAAVTAVDPARRVVTLDDGREIAYDYLILAAGARHAYFGHDEWESFAPGLKSIEDAVEIRRRFLLAFERAERTEDPAERVALQTFVIVGGGPTGCELAGVMPDIARKALRSDFRNIDTAATRVILVEAAPRLLGTFPEKLGLHARRDLEDLGVEVRTGAAVTRIDESGVWLGDEHIDTRTVFWGAGNAASPLARGLGVPLDRAGRVPVAHDLSVEGHAEIFVVGDLAATTQKNGSPVPGVAQGAIQGGRVAAQNVLRTIRGEPRRSFEYWDKGNLATIGRHKAVGDFTRFTVTGRIAWWLWLTIHVLYLAGFRNRVSVLIQWAWAYVTYQRGVRLITVRPPAARPSR
jgi:NADH:ubiquinone reductase (H+-translocating)